MSPSFLFVSLVSDKVNIIIIGMINIQTNRIHLFFIIFRTLYISIIAIMHRSVGLTMKKMCGELECPEYYLCEIHDLQCYPCHSYCNQTSNNFDVNRCEQQCQGTFTQSPYVESRNVLIYLRAFFL